VSAPLASLLTAVAAAVTADACSLLGDAFDVVVGSFELVLRRLAGRDWGCSETSADATSRSMYGRSRARRDRKNSWVVIPAFPISESG